MAKIEDQGEKIVTTHGTVTKKQYDAVIEEMRQRKNAPVDINRTPAKQKCPIRKSACTDICALYDNGSCSMISGAKCQDNKQCPYDHDAYIPMKCGTGCTMYVNGYCAMTGKREGANSVKV